MSKLSLFIVLLFLGLLALFSLHNNDMTTIKVPFGQSYELPKIGVILLSSLAGAMVVAVLFVLRDTRRFIHTYQAQRRLKKEQKVQALYSRALDALLGGDLKEAQEALEALLKEEPRHLEALLRMAEVAQREGQPQKALEYYRRVLSLEPQHLEALLKAAGLELSLGHLKEALEYAEQVLEPQPDNLSALALKRTVLERQGQWSELVELQRQVLKHPHLKEQAQEEQRLLGYRYELARQSLEEGQLDRALKLFRNILKADRRFVPAYLGAAEALLRDGEAEEAAKLLEEGYEETHSEILLARLEDLSLGQGEPERAIKLYQQALGKRPEEASLRFLLGKLYWRLEMVEDALRELQPLEGAEDFPALYSLLGELYMRRQLHERAAQSFRKAAGPRPARLPYVCSTCQGLSRQWSGRCPHCGAWGTFRLGIHGSHI